MLIHVKDNALIKSVIFFLFTTFLFHGSAFAQSPFVGPSPLGPIQSESVTITGKSNEAVWIKERIFLVTKETRIMDAEGNSIPLNRLPIPCEANIKYDFGKKQDPVCLKISVGQQKKER